MTVLISPAKATMLVDKNKMEQMDTDLAYLGIVFNKMICEANLKSVKFSFFSSERRCTKESAIILAKEIADLGYNVRCFTDETSFEYGMIYVTWT